MLVCVFVDRFLLFSFRLFCELQWCLWRCSSCCGVVCDSWWCCLTSGCCVRGTLVFDSTFLFLIISPHLRTRFYLTRSALCLFPFDAELWGLFFRRCRCSFLAPLIYLLGCLVYLLFLSVLIWGRGFHLERPSVLVVLSLIC